MVRRNDAEKSVYRGAGDWDSEAGQPVAELCRELGITQQTFYRWRRKFGGMEVSDAQEMNRLLDENRRLKHLVAELSLDNRILKDVLGKK